MDFIFPSLTINLFKWLDMSKEGYDLTKKNDILFNPHKVYGLHGGSRKKRKIWA